MTTCHSRKYIVGRCYIETSTSKLQKNKILRTCHCASLFTSKDKLVNRRRKMKLFIAEKPSLAQAIATGIGVGKKFDGYISLNGGKEIEKVSF